MIVIDLPRGGIGKETIVFLGRSFGFGFGFCFFFFLGWGGGVGGVYNIKQHFCFAGSNA